MMHFRGRRIQKLAGDPRLPGVSFKRGKYFESACSCCNFCFRFEYPIWILAISSPQIFHSMDSGHSSASPVCYRLQAVIGTRLASHHIPYPCRSVFCGPINRFKASTTDLTPTLSSFHFQVNARKRKPPKNIYPPFFCSSKAPGTMD